jgi:hypothetical protein
MADRHLIEVREPPEQLEIQEVQVVAGIDPQAERMGQPRGARIHVKGLAARLLATLKGTREGFGVQLDTIRAHAGCPPDWGFSRIHEQTDANALCTQIAHGTDNDTGLVGRPSTLTRDLAWLHRYQRALRGHDVAYERDEVWTRVTFDVELDAPAERWQERRNLMYVGRRDVPAVRSRVHRDAGRTRADAHANGVENGRHGSAARVPDRGNFVDVN